MSSDTSAKKSDYSVGYKKPPKHSQFKPGRSGNPRGRPRKTAVRAPEVGPRLFAKIMQERVRVTINGTEKRMPRGEYFYRKTLARAEEGDIKARAEVYRMLKDADGVEAVPQGGGVLVIPAAAETVEEWQIMADGQTKLAAAKQAALEAGATPAEIEEVDQESKAKIAEIRNAKTEENDDEDDWGPPH